MRKHLQKFLPRPETVRENRWLRPFAAWLRDPRLWHINRRSVAGAVAVGLFCGLIPGPLQMPAAAAGALVLRVNLPIALFTTLYSNPFTIVPLYLAAYEIGRIASGDGAGFVPPPPFDWGNWLQWGRATAAWVTTLGRPLGIGLAILATALAGGGYLAVLAAWRLWLAMAWRRRRR